MILAYMPFDNLYLPAQARLPYQLPRSQTYRSFQNVIAVFRDPHEVILYVVQRVCPASVLRHTRILAIWLKLLRLKAKDSTWRLDIETVYDWIPQIHAASDIVIPNLSQDAQQRLETASPSIDGVFVLKKGFLYFDNVPFGFATSEIRAANPSLKWIHRDTDTGNLLLLFLFLQTATANLEGKWLNPVPYLKSFNFPDFSMFNSY